MQFVVIATDATDPEALSRRLAHREAHIAMIETLKQQGHFYLGGPTLDDAGTMNGSILICEFESRDALNEWLAQEPFVISNVWGHIEVKPYEMGPSFQVAANFLHKLHTGATSPSDG